MIPMDAILIEQVLINLLENAVVHAKSTQPVCLKVSVSQGMVLFEVIDQGVGIPRELLDTLFDGAAAEGVRTAAQRNMTDHKRPPAAGNAASADSHKGMGIGLSICKTIVLAHNGTITAKNYAQGAVFAFTLPLEHPERKDICYG